MILQTLRTQENSKEELTYYLVFKDLSLRKKRLGDYSEMAHLFPYRTQKLSISAAMVAMPDIVRVARCQVFFLLYFIKTLKI